MVRNVLCILSLLLFLFVGAGCQNEGPAEKAGKKIDNVIEEVKDKAEDVGDKAEDVVDKAEDKMD